MEFKAMISLKKKNDDLHQGTAYRTTNNWRDPSTAEYVFMYRQDSDSHKTRNNVNLCLYGKILFSGYVALF